MDNPLFANRYRSDGTLETVAIRVSDGVISEIKVYQTVDDGVPVVLPGFVDIHVHGGGGSDTMDATPDAFRTIAETHAQHGTTSFLLTTVTATPDSIMQVLESAKPYVSTGGRSTGRSVGGSASRSNSQSHSSSGDGLLEGGANILGVHLEGPFVNPNKAGAQRPDHMQTPDVHLTEQWLATGVVKMMTMAPELAQAHEVARLAQSRGVVVSAGHTVADWEDMHQAREAGFSHVTHLCNAMNPLLHRNVGPIGYAVEDEGLTADFICDGVHLDSAMMKVLVRSIGAERLCLITDAIRAATLGEGVYDLGGLPVTVANGACHLADGSLAGSVLTMDAAYRHAQRLIGVSPYLAQQMASTNPARKLGLVSKGLVEVGFDADLVLLNKEGLVQETIVAGRTVYKRTDAS